VGFPVNIQGVLTPYTVEEKNEIILIGHCLLYLLDELFTLFVQLLRVLLIFPTRIGIGIQTGEAETAILVRAADSGISVTESVVLMASGVQQLNKEFSRSY
jgi:hypothetical protein